MVSEISAFDWHAMLQCFYFNFRALLQGRSQTSLDVPLCAFVCVRTAVCCAHVFCLCASVHDFVPNSAERWQMCEPLNVCSYLILFSCLFALGLRVSMWHFYTGTLCLCVFEIWSHLPCNHHIHTLFLILTEPFSRPTSFHIPLHSREWDRQIDVENINAIDSQFSLSRV